MIPLRDSQPRGGTPYITLLLIVLNVLVFFVELSFSPNSIRYVDGRPWIQELGVTPPAFNRLLYQLYGRGTLYPVTERDYFILQYSLIPVEFWSGKDLPPKIPIPIWFTLFTSMFLHGGWLHLIGNMWFLWLFGDNVEWAMGRLRYLVFYLLCGVVAAFSQMLVSLHSAIPQIGASGAIAGVMGAYLVLFPWARILTLVPFFFFYYFMEIPAVLFLGFWFLLQFFSAVSSFSHLNFGGVAWFAHLGGFVSGALLVFLFKRRWVIPGLVSWWRMRRYYRPPWGWWP